MLVRDCMTKKVELGNPGMTLSEAAKKMRDGDFGTLPISEGDRLIGMLTDRDITIRAVAEGRDPKTTPVREIMSKGTLYCYDDQSIQEVGENMGQIQMRRLPVLNRQKRLVGILSLGDMALSEPNYITEPFCRISEHQHRDQRSMHV